MRSPGGSAGLTGVAADALALAFAAAPARSPVLELELVEGTTGGSSHASMCARMISCTRRLVVSGEMANDRMTLRAETTHAPQGLADRLALSIRDVTKLRGEVELLAPGTLPNDGKVIEDARSYA